MKRAKDTLQQKGHNRCVCGHLDAHHRLWDKLGQQGCRLSCDCEQFQRKPHEEEAEVASE